MKISINISEEVKDTEISISCNQLTPDVYESKLKLYEMEERLCESGFFRASKSVLVQLRKKY